jgi:hypothetical protein
MGSDCSLRRGTGTDNGGFDGPCGSDGVEEGSVVSRQGRPAGGLANACS